MRVPFCNAKCLPVCFSKSSDSLQSPFPSKLDDAQKNVSSNSPVSHVLEEESIGVAHKDESCNVEVETFVKSSLKKPQGSGSEEVEKRRVKWRDFVGKELAEIREFEVLDSGELEDENGNQTCACIIQ